MNQHSAIKRARPRGRKWLRRKRQAEIAAGIVLHARLMAETGYRPKGVRP